MYCIFILHYYIVLHVHYYNVLHHYNVLHYLYEIQEEQRINIGEIKLFVKKNATYRHNSCITRLNIYINHLTLLELNVGDIQTL